MNIDGDQKDFSDKSLALWPLKDGKSVIFPRDCADNCEIKVVSPFGTDAELTYRLPWGTQSGAFSEGIGQLLPDQSFLFVGSSSRSLSTKPAALQAYPDLKDDDSPVFRLTPDGQARLVGITQDATSPDGRYTLMRSSDQTAFFIYDVVEDRPLFTMPIDPDLEEYLTKASFFDDGILVNLTASVPGGQKVYRNFYHAYSYKTSTSRAWEDAKLEFNGCPDLLEDGSVVCWLYRTDTSNADLIRYDPSSGTKTPLLENVWLIDFTP